MMKHVAPAFAGILLTAAVIQGQPAPMTSSFQNPGWISTAGSNQVIVHVNRPDGQAGPVLGKPVFATEVRHTMQTLTDNTHVDRSENSLFFRDAQGRMRIESRTRVIIYDPVAGFTYTLNPAARTYRKTPAGVGVDVTSIAVDGSSTWVDRSAPRSSPAVRTLSQAGAALPMHTEPLVSAVTEDLPAQFIGGVSAKGSRLTMAIPVGAFGNDREVKVVNERWYSEGLQLLVKSQNSDPRFGVSTYELTNIVQSPPDPALFQVPADYTPANDESYRQTYVRKE